MKCPAGTFQNEVGKSSCKPCPAGHYSPIVGIQGIDLCRPCPAGTFSSSTGVASIDACQKCPSGTNAQRGAAKCISCPPGTAIVNCELQPSTLAPFRDFRGTCFDCFFGTLSVGCGPMSPVDPNCNVCGENFFPPFSGPNALDCENCPEGTFFDEKAIECKDEPSNCPAGSAPRNGRCEMCTSFQFSDGSIEGCRNCPAGSQGNVRAGSTRCVPCPPGTSKKDNQSSTCEPCGMQENSFVTGGKYCFNDNIEECPPGFFKGKGGACLTCTIFERFDPEKKVCLSCPENSLSKGGVSMTCERCEEGMTTDSQYNRCVCKPGWGFVLGSNGSTCEKCAPGTANNNPIGTCEMCETNFFTPTAGLTSCLSCPEGMEQPMLGENKCIRKAECEDGFFERDSLGCVEEETNCPPNHRRIEEDGFNPTCEPLSADACPTGTLPIFQGDVAIVKTCGACFSNRRYNPRTMRCEPCMENEIVLSGLSTECVRCKNGTIPVGRECRCTRGRRIVNGQCIRCPAGTFGLRNTDGCYVCPAGTFSDGTNLESCQTCRAGTFTDRPGQGRCKPCPTGMTSFGFGETGCVLAPN